MQPAGYNAVRLYNLACRALSYLQVVDGLAAVEKEMLTRHLAHLRAALQPGFSPLIWTSLTIPDFLQAAERVRCCPHTHNQEAAEQRSALMDQQRVVSDQSAALWGWSVHQEHTRSMKSSSRELMQCLYHRAT